MQNETNHLSIFKAIKENDQKSIQQFLNETTEIELKDPDGFTPLHWAALKGNQWLTVKLRERGAIIDQQSIPFNAWKKVAQSQTFLQRLIELVGAPSKEIIDNLLKQAALASNYSVAKYLLKLGATPNMGDCRNKKIALLFLSSGADINQKREGEYTFLHTAVSLFDEELIEFALRKGAKIDCQFDYSYGLSSYSPLQLTNDYYNLCQVSPQKKEKIQSLFMPYIIKQQSKAAFLFLLKNNYDVNKLNFNQLDITQLENIIQWIDEFLDNNNIPLYADKKYIDSLRNFTEKVIHYLHPGLKEKIKERLDDFLQFSLDLIIDGKYKVVEELKSYSQLAHLLGKDLASKITHTLKLLHIDHLNLSENSVKNITLHCPIEEHAAYLFDQVYSNYYPTEDTSTFIARYYHGMTHASRAAIYIPVFLNLYKKYGNEAALQITDEDIKLIQLAAFLHDAGRQGEGVDYWDKHSGFFVYTYLKKLKVPQDKAKLLAEAVTNKDQNGIYYELVVEGNQLSWKSTVRPFKNIYQQLIHDADCLDIIRVRSSFKYKYLDFYKEVAQKNLEALEEMHILINEATQLIDKNGDAYTGNNASEKEKYECAQGYQQILTNINADNAFPLLKKLYTPSKSLSKEELTNSSLNDNNDNKAHSGNIEEQFNAALLNGKLFARGITNPSHTGKNKKNLSETNAHLEVRKCARRYGVPTQTQKANNKQKQGNPNRSISMIGWGRDVFAKVGFLLLDLDPNLITSISKENACTGFGKKNNFTPKVKDLYEIERKLINLKYFLKRKASEEKNTVFEHVELTYNVQDYQGIYYSTDDTNQPTTRFLEAIYLQKEYERVYHHKLPIFCYSPLQQSIKLIAATDYSDDKLKEIWGRACREYFEKKLASNSDNAFKLLQKSSKEIKIRVMSHTKSDKVKSLDSNYEPSLKMLIDDAIEAELNDALIKTYDKLKTNSAHSAYELICNIYLNRIKAPAQPSLFWLKESVHSKTDLFGILDLLPSNHRFGFLMTLGGKFISELLINIENFHRCFTYLNQEEIDLLKETLNHHTNIFLTLQDLIHAIKQGNQNAINSIITLAPNLISSADIYGLTPLHWAVILGDIELVERLISHHADIHTITQTGENMLHLAAWHGHNELVKFFLAKGFDPNQGNITNKTAIDGAIEFGYNEIFDCLLKSGAKTEFTAIPPFKLLINYLKNKDMIALKKLFETNPTFDNQNKLEALKHIDFNDHDFATFILNSLDNIDFTHANQYLLFDQLNNDHANETLNLLLSHGLELKNGIGYHLIKLAMSSREYGITKLLIKAGAPLYIPNKLNHTSIELLDFIRNTFDDYKNPAKAQVFLNKMFDIFAQVVFDKNMSRFLDFFLEHLNKMNLGSIDFTCLDTKKIDNILNTIQTFIKEPDLYPWTVNESKRYQLEELIQNLTSIKLSQTMKQNYCSVLTLFPPAKRSNELETTGQLKKIMSP